MGLAPSDLKTPEDWIERIHPEDRQAWKDAADAHLRVRPIVAEHEREMISARTKAALAAAKARGVKLGRPENLSRGDVGTRRSAEVRAARAAARARDLTPTIGELREGGATSLRALARGLNDRGVPASRGGTWHAAQVRDMLRRMGEGS